MSTSVKCNVLLLKTKDLFSKIVELDSGELIIGKPNHFLWGHKHLYVTGPDEIKLDDWVYGEKKLFQVKTLNKITGICRDIEGFPFVTDACKKVIASTDIEVLYDRNIRTEKGEFEQKTFEEGALCANFKKTDVLFLSDNFIQYYIDRFNICSIIDEIPVEYSNVNQFCEEIIYDEAKPMQDSQGNIKIEPFKETWTRAEIYEVLNKAGRASYIMRGDDFFVNQKFIELFLDVPC